MTRAQDLVREIYPPGGLRPMAIASLASHVQEAAEEGDAIAGRIIARGAEELASAATSVARQLKVARGAVVLAGGVFRGVPLMRSMLTRLLREALPDFRVRSLAAKPAFGAVRLARRLLDGTLDVPTYVEQA